MFIKVLKIFLQEFRKLKCVIAEEEEKEEENEIVSYF